MTWLTWRQHRLEVALISLAVGALVAVLMVLGLQARALFPDGVEACIATDSCAEAWLRIDDRFDFVKKSLVFLKLVPFVVGAFLGASMLTRELESGTWQLAWTQSVPRMRWLAVKLIALGTFAVLATAALSAAIAYFRGPENAVSDRFSDGFDLEGVVPAAYAFFAFAAGAAAGIVVRRGLAAIAAAFAAFILLRVPVATFLRANYVAPQERTMPVVPGEEVVSPRYGQSVDVDPHDWVLEVGYAYASGERVTNRRFDELVAAATQSGTDPATHLHAEGVHRYALVQPGDRFWTFQFIESAIFVALGAVLIAYVVWRVHRRRV